MGSGVLLAALVVLWFVVLVPMVVTRGDAQGAGWGLLTPVGRCSGVGRWTPWSTPTPNVSRSTVTCCAPAVSCRSTCTLCGVAHWPAWPRSPALAARRCRHLQPLAVGGAGPPRRRRRRLPAGAAQGRPPRAAGGPPGSPCRGPGGAADAGRRPGAAGPRRRGVHETVAKEALPSLPHPSVPLAPVHQLPDGPPSWSPARRLRPAGSRARWSVWTTTTSGSPTSTSTSRAAWPTPDRVPTPGSPAPPRWWRRRAG